MAEFLEPPLYAARRAEGHGTLDAVVSRPKRWRRNSLWPQARVKQGIEAFSEMGLRVGFA